MKIGQINTSYIGTTYQTPKGGTLTVIGYSDKRRGKNIIWHVECSICSIDKELFPEPFNGNKFQMDSGQCPCACSPYRYSERQNVIRLKRKGLIVKRVVGKTFHVEDIENDVCYSSDVTRLLNGYSFEPVIKKSLRLRVESENSSESRMISAKNEFNYLAVKNGFTLLGEYLNAHVPVKIKCKNGHITSPQPAGLKHRGWTCGRCNRIQEKQKAESEKRALDCGYKIIKRGKRSSNGTENQSIVKCLACGFDFKITVSKLLSPSSSDWHEKCPVCTNKKKELRFINAATANGFEVLSSFKDNNSRVKVKCSFGHEISVRPYNFSLNPNCQECNGGGYKSSRPGYLYILRHESESFYKIGISNNPKQRIIQLRRATPFSFDVIGIYHNNDGRVALNAETEIHRMHHNAGLNGFDGATEWVAANGSIIDLPTRLGLKYEM